MSSFLALINIGGCLDDYSTKVKSTKNIIIMYESLEIIIDQRRWTNKTGHSFNGISY